jgi:hypothetical protein
MEAIEFFTCLSPHVYLLGMSLPLPLLSLRLV